MLMNEHHGHHELDGRSETKVWVTASDTLYTRADLLVRRENHLGALVDGVMLDLGVINDDLASAMSLASQVFVRAGHVMGHQVERRVPIVHQ
jgi:hypothetical protein